MNTLQQIVDAIATAITTILLASGQNSTSGSSAVKFTNGTYYGFYFILIAVEFLLSFTIKEDRD